MGGPPFDVVGVGALNVDRVHTVSRATLDGLETLEGSVMDAGGCAANTVYALARLGLRCGYLGAVGEDPEAEVALASFRSAGVDTSGIVHRRGTHTGSVLIISDRAGHRAMYQEPGANHAFRPEDVRPDYLAGAGLVHVSSFNGELPPAVQAALLGALPREAVLALTLDGQLARRGSAAVAPLLSRCDVLFANREEIGDVTVGEGPGALLAAGCRTVVMTLGPGEGGACCRIYSGDGERAVPFRQTMARPIADATGAGDAFAAGYLWGLLAGWAPEECGALGHTLAGFVLEEAGCRAGVPCRKELLARYRRFFGGEVPAV